MPPSLLSLPSLDLVRGFVAVGRRMSVTLAAQDLCLTQSAVSRQLRTLERQLGVSLFRRGHRSLAFTPEGEAFFCDAEAALRRLQDAVEALPPRGRRPVTITASIGVAALWLLPRLSALQRLHPDIDLRIAANDRLLDLRAEHVDLGIRYCEEHRAPPAARMLFGETILPVARPDLAAGALADARALSAQVLLEFDAPRHPQLQWADPLAALGLGGARPRGMLRFNQYDQVIQAALAGQGLALGRRALVAPLLADGRLAVIGGTAARASGYGYWLHQAEPAPRPEVAEVAAWIAAQARAAMV